MNENLSQRDFLFAICLLNTDSNSGESHRDAREVELIRQHFFQEKSNSLAESLIESGVIDSNQAATVDQHVSQYVADLNDSLDDLETPLNPPVDPNATVLPLSSNVDTNAGGETDTNPDLFATRSIATPNAYQTIVSDSSRGNLRDNRLSQAERSPLRFQTIRLHAQGGLGEIYLANDREIHREVALKEIKNAFGNDPDHQEMFISEGEITGSLEHPGVVPVYGMGRYEDGRPFYAMRFVRGETLAAAIKKFHAPDAPQPGTREQSLALRQLLTRFVDVCNAIHYAHSRGVIHRDIKPDNIMLGPYGETLVVDWGLAMLIENESESTPTDEAPIRLSGSANRNDRDGNERSDQRERVVGTLQFMPPEQALGKQDEMSPASDVFSLGATLYKLLTNENFYGGTSVGVMLKLAQTRQSIPARQVNATVSPALEAIVEKATALSASDRYATARLLADDIESYLADEPITARRDPFSDRVRRWLRQHRALATGTLAAILFSLAGLIAFVLLLTTKNAEIVTERDLAQQNFESARNAVHQSMVMVSEDPQLKEEGMLELRHRLLRAPESYYDDFLSQAPDDPQLRADQAEWRLLLTRAVFDADTRQAAIDHVRQAETIFEELTADHPNQPRYVRGVAEAKNLYGVLLLDIGKYDEATQKLEGAVEAGENHLRIEPDANPIILCAALANLSDLKIMHGEPNRAREMLQRAIDVRRDALKDFPNDGPLMRTNPERNLVKLLVSTGNIQEADKLSQKAISLLQEFEPPAAERNSVEFELATQLSFRGDFHVIKGLPSEGARYYRDALEIIEQLLERNPGNLLYQSVENELNVRLLTPVHRVAFAADSQKIEEQLRSSISRFEKLVKRDPDLLQNRLGLVEAQLALLKRKTATSNLPNEVEAILEDAETTIDAAAKKFGTVRPIKLARANVCLARFNFLIARSEFVEAKGKLDEANVIITEFREERDYLLERSTAFDIQLGFGQLAIADREFDEAAELVDELLRQLNAFPSEFQQTANWQSSLSFVDELRSQIIAEDGNVREALAILDSAIQRREELVEATPGEPLYRALAVIAQIQIGMKKIVYYSAMGKADDVAVQTEVMRYLRSAADQLDSLDPRTLSVTFIEQFIDIKKQLASEAFLEIVKTEDAIADLRSGIELANVLFARNGNDKYLLSISEMQLALAEHLYDGDESQYMKACEEARLSVERYLYHHPDDLRAKEALWSAYISRGEVFWANAEYQNSMREFDQAVVIEGVSDPTHPRIIRAILHAHLGNHGTAVDMVRGTVKMPEMSEIDWFNVGTAYAISIEAVQRDASLDDATKEQMRSTYIAAANDALETARKKGAFMDDGDVEYLREGDETLKSIRDSEQFKELLKRVEEDLK